MMVEDIAVTLFIPTYLLWAYFIKRSSSWLYAIATSILWGPFMYENLKIYSQAVLVYQQEGLQAALGEIFIAFVVFTSGAFIISLFYVWPAWGLNRAKWGCWILTSLPTPLILTLGVGVIIFFHVFDVLIYRTFVGKTMRSQFKNLENGPDDSNNKKDYSWT